MANRVPSGKKPGPPSRGSRTPIMLRVPDEHHEFYRERASREGFKHLSDWLLKELAERNELPIPSYIKPASADAQGVLPISA